MRLKIIPPRPPTNLLSGEISATNYSAATTMIVSRRRTAVSDQKNPVIIGRAHECKICHKVFSSGAALGGHQTTHRKIKSSQGGGIRPCNGVTAAPTTILNRISFCGKKRKHDNYEGKLWFITISDSSSDGINNSGVNSFDEGASKTRVRLDIDLNLPPTSEFC